MRVMTKGDVILSGKSNDIIRYRVYFGDEDPAVASLWSTDQITLFNKGQDELVSNVTTGAAVTLRKCDTSLFNSNGIIPKATSFTVMAIGIDIHLASVQATTVFSDNTVTNIDINPETKVNPYPLVETIRSQGVFSLYRNATEFLESGNVADYPCGLYHAGWGSNGQATVPAAAGFTPGAAYTINGFIVAQNGMAFRELTVWHVLEELDQFHGRFEVCRPMTLTGSGLVGYIDFLLVGQTDLDREARQFVQDFGPGQ